MPDVLSLLQAHCDGHALSGEERAQLLAAPLKLREALAGTNGRSRGGAVLLLATLRPRELARLGPLADREGAAALEDAVRRSLRRNGVAVRRALVPLVQRWPAPVEERRALLVDLLRGGVFLADDALRAHVALGDAAAQDALLDELLPVAPAAVRALALRILGPAGRPERVGPLLLQAMRQPAFVVRLAALQGWPEGLYPGTRRLLVAAGLAEGGAVRRAALNAMRVEDAPEAELRAALASAEVAEAVAALGVLARSPVTPGLTREVLTAACRSAVPRLFEAAARAVLAHPELHALLDADWVAALQGLPAARRRGLLDGVVACARGEGFVTLLPTLVALAGAEDEHLRRRALWRLGQAPPALREAVRPVVLAGLGDLDPVTVRVAHWALFRVSGDGRVDQAARDPKR